MIKIKNRYALIFSAVGLILSCSPSIQKSETSSPGLQKIAFGSCASQEKDQPIWQNVINKSPDLFIFTGDNIYADTEDTIVMKNLITGLKKILTA
jgi:alkaline phosphatase D